MSDERTIPRHLVHALIEAAGFDPKAVTQVTIAHGEANWLQVEVTYISRPPTSAGRLRPKSDLVTHPNGVIGFDLHVVSIPVE